MHLALAIQWDVQLGRDTFSLAAEPSLPASCRRSFIASGRDVSQLTHNKLIEAEGWGTCAEGRDEREGAQRAAKRREEKNEEPRSNTHGMAGVPRLSHWARMRQLYTRAPSCARATFKSRSRSWINYESILPWESFLWNWTDGDRRVNIGNDARLSNSSLSFKLVSWKETWWERIIFIA